MISTFGLDLIDLVRFVTGLVVNRVSASIQNVQINQKARNCDTLETATSGNNYVNIQMTLRPWKNPVDDVMANLTLNGLDYGLESRQYQHELTLHGPDGYLVLRNGDLFGKLHMNSENITKESSFYIDEASKNSSVSGSQPAFYWNGMSYMLGAIAQAFKQNLTPKHNQDAIQNGHPTTQSPSSPLERQSIHWDKQCLSQIGANFDDALYLQSVYDALLESSHAQKWIHLDSLQ